MKPRLGLLRHLALISLTILMLRAPSNANAADGAATSAQGGSTSSAPVDALQERTLSATRSVRIGGQLGPVMLLRINARKDRIFTLVAEGDTLRVVPVDLKSGEVGNPVYQQPLLGFARGGLWVHPNGQHIIVASEGRDELRVCDVDRATVTTRLRPPPETGRIFNCFISKDGTRVVGAIEGGRLVVWDFVTGEIRSSANVDGIAKEAPFGVFPGADEEHVLAASRAAGDQQNIEVLVVRLNNGQIQAREMLGREDGLFAEYAGDTFIVLRDSDPDKVAWTDVDTRDRRTLKLRETQPLQPTQSTIEVQVSADGRHLFLLEYMVQILMVRDLRARRWTLLREKEACCARAFDISSDGTKLVAYMGEWNAGALFPDRIVEFDLSELDKP